MRKTKGFSDTAVLIAWSVLPFFGIVARIFGCVFELKSYTVFSVLLVLITAVKTVFDITNKTHKGKTLIILPFLALISWCTCFVRYSEDVALVVLTIGFVTTVVIAELRISKAWLKMVSGLAAFFIAVFLGLISMFSFLGKVTLKEQVPSPNGEYYIQIIEHDEGALGGATSAEIRRKAYADNFVFSIYKRPLRVYLGDWGEIPDIMWKDESTVVVDSQEYTIK